MDIRKINKNRMYGATETVLDNNQNYFVTIQELVDAHQMLKLKKAIIDKNREVQETDRKGLTKIKGQLRKESISMILRFSGAIAAHATTVKDVDLKTKVEYTLSYLDKTSDLILVDIANVVYNLATPLTNELSKFFIGSSEFQQFGQLIPAFKAAIPKKRAAGTVSKVSTNNIDLVFKEIDQLLNDEIDVLMQPFQFTQPDFYNSYMNSRMIVDYSGRGKSKPDEDPKA
jgi:hypothetical protein